MPRYVTARDLLIARKSMGEDVVIPPPPKKRSNEESIAQCALIAWWATAHAAYGVPECLLFSIPNGGKRDPKVMYFLKREGLRNGASDIFVSVPRGGYHGLYVEMKAAKGIVSDDQDTFMTAVCAQHYAAHVCRSTEEAKKTIHEYLTQ